jgi:hypothetical protein
MIKMHQLYEQPEYPVTLKRFNTSKKETRWSLFKGIHLLVTHERCPICECRLDGSTSRQKKAKSADPNKHYMIQTPTIDHYRPKDKTLYPFLKYDDRNYILMCSDCNQAYKGNLFPLYNNTVRAKDKATLINEQPLIVNPILDDLLALFILVFTQTSSGKKVLELMPKKPNGYLHDKAKETIKVFSLGECDINGHKNPNIHDGRIKVLNDHYNKLFAFASAYQSYKNSNDEQKQQNKTQALRELHALQPQHFGFTEFILKQQFIMV